MSFATYEDMSCDECLSLLTMYGKVEGFYLECHQCSYGVKLIDGDRHEPDNVRSLCKKNCQKNCKESL